MLGARGAGSRGNPLKNPVQLIIIISVKNETSAIIFVQPLLVGWFVVKSVGVLLEGWTKI